MHKKFRFSVALLCLSLILNGTTFSAAASDNRVIGFKISSLLYDSSQGKGVPTPPAVIEKIKKAFKLWESDKADGLHFDYKGLFEQNYKDAYNLPNDGNIYIILNGKGSEEEGVAGEGSYLGKIPNDYKKGWAALSTARGFFTLSFNTLIHEIGHALGLQHSPSPANIMFCGTHAWGDDEYLTFSEQDRADLRGQWAPDSVYSISGVAETSETSKWLMVYAVNIENGHAYSALTDNKGAFTIHLLKAAEYRVFAKGYEHGADKPFKQCPSWFISNEKSTNDPYAGTVLSVNDSRRDIRDIRIRLIDKAVPFNLFRGWMDLNKKDIPRFSFLTAGASSTFSLFSIPQGALKSVEGYGKAPDYSFSALHWETPGGFHVTATIKSGAEEGERLMIAKGDEDIIQAGLVGLNIVKEAPREISVSPEEQVAGKFDYVTLDAHYWQK